MWLFSTTTINTLEIVIQCVTLIVNSRENSEQAQLRAEMEYQENVRHQPWDWTDAAGPTQSIQTLTENRIFSSTVTWVHYVRKIIIILIALFCFHHFVHHWKKKTSGHVETRKMGKDSALLNSGLDASFFWRGGVHEGQEASMSVDWHQLRGIKSPRAKWVYSVMFNDTIMLQNKIYSNITIRNLHKLRKKGKK